MENLRTLSFQRLSHLESLYQSHILLIILHRYCLYKGRDSSVSIATGYGVDGRGGRSPSPGSVKNFLFSTSPRTALGPTQPPMKWVTWPLSLGVKRPGSEADHSPPAGAEVKKIWIYTSTPLYAFMA
jgi:hypothetical protein